MAVYPKSSINQNLPDISSFKTQLGDKEIDSLSNRVKSIQSKFNQELNKELSKEEIRAGIDLAYKEVAQNFEKDYLAIMWNFAFENIEVDSLFGGGSAEETFRSELVKNYVYQAYGSERSGIYEAVYKSLKKQENLDGQQHSTEGVNENSNG